MKSKDKYFDFINFAYGIGAAIVIIGAMFKFLGWDYANEFFLVGLTMEAVVFSISAFEFKKKKIIAVPPKVYNWENVFPQLRDEFGSTTPDGFSKIFEDNMTNTSTIIKSLENFNLSIEKLNAVTGALAENVNRISGHIEKIENTTENYALEMKLLKENIKQINGFQSSHLSNLTTFLPSQEREFHLLNENLLKMNAFYAAYLLKNEKNSEDFEKEFDNLKNNMSKVNSFYKDMLSAMGKNSLPSA